MTQGFNDTQAENIPNSKDYTTRELIDSMIAILSQDEVARQINETMKQIAEKLAVYKGPTALPPFDMSPLTNLAIGFKENQRYAIAILERMYKGLHPEAYDDPHKGRIF